jgi:hypothetical protein
MALLHLLIIALFVLAVPYMARAQARGHRMGRFQDTLVG